MIYFVLCFSTFDINILICQNKLKKTKKNILIDNKMMIEKEKQYICSLGIIFPNIFDLKEDRLYNKLGLPILSI